MSSGGGAGMDLACVLARQLGGAIGSFDDSTSGGLNPAIDTVLPKGSYFLLLYDVNHRPGTFQFTVTVAPQAIPAAPCGNSAIGSVRGAESRVFHRLVLPAAQRVRFTTAGVLNDTVLSLFDAAMGLIATNDDDGFTTYSVLDLPLPATEYYLEVRGFGGSSGSFLLAGTCNQPAQVTPITAGVIRGNLAGIGQSVAFAFEPKTAVPVQFRVDSSGGTLPDPQLSLLDDQGVAFGFDDDGGPGLDSFAGTWVPADRALWVLVREFGAATGSFDLVVEAPLHRNAAGHLFSHDKGGRWVALFGSGRLAASPLPAPAPIAGNLLLDPSGLAFFFVFQLPSSGVLGYPLDPFNGWVQGLSMVELPFAGRLTNVVR
jgi:hypothetical protein